jgi:hypothetical protein
MVFERPSETGWYKKACCVPLVAVGSAIVDVSASAFVDKFSAWFSTNTDEAAFASGPARTTE